MALLNRRKRIIIVNIMKTFSVIKMATYILTLASEETQNDYSEMLIEVLKSGSSL